MNIDYSILTLYREWQTLRKAKTCKTKNYFNVLKHVGPQEEEGNWRKKRERERERERKRYILVFFRNGVFHRGFVFEIMTYL